MQGNRGRDTRPELAIRSRVYRLGLRYRVNERPLKGLRRTADMVFRSVKVAVFVDGCFWHGCPAHATQPKTNAQYWADKIETNRERDRQTDQLLQQSGWTVLRFWEHENPETAAETIVESVQALKSS